MKCQEIYDLALVMINENANNSDTQDLEARAPGLLWAVCLELADLNYWYSSQFYGYATERGTPIEKISSLEDEFPLHSRFTSAAAYALGRLLMNEENVTLSNKLDALYADQIAKIRLETPAEIRPIKNVYL